MKSPYQMFATDESLETKGIVLDYGGFRICIARAGGANAKFRRIAQAKMKPYRKQIETQSMDDAVSRRIMAEIYAESVVVGWEGVVDQKGDPMEFTTENVVKLFTDLPELFADVMEQSNAVSNYRKEQIEDDGKN